jgi:hypothetical protein
MNRLDAKHNPYYAANVVNTAAITIGDETTDRTVAIQLQDANARDIDRAAAVRAYLSDDAEGQGITATAPDSVAAGAAGTVLPIVAGKCFELVSDAAGVVEVVLTENGAATWYLVLIMPDGGLVVSDAISFAA